MKNRTSKTQGIKTLFLAALSSGLMAGCGMTPPPLPTGERVPVNHYEGQWKPAKDLSARHETPQEKAERLRKGRLREIQRQNEQTGKNPGKPLPRADTAQLKSPDEEQVRRQGGTNSVPNSSLALDADTVSTDSGANK